MNSLRLAAVLTLLPAFMSCGGEDSALLSVPDESDGVIFVSNDEGTLAGRVVEMEEPILIDNGGNAILMATTVTLTLKSQVTPPTVSGTVLQATSIAMDGSDKAVVSYGSAGPLFLGAIDWFTKMKENNPKLTSSASFTDRDINAVDFDGTNIYAAQCAFVNGTGNALLQRLKLQNDKITLSGATSRTLGGFAATSVFLASSEVYATCGDAGRLSAFDKSNLNLIDYVSMDDARWVAWDKDNDRMACVQGNPGRLSTWEEGSLDYIDEFDFDGADVPESKSTVVVAGGKAFIAAGPAGVQILSLETGEVVGSVPVPDAQALGLDPADVVTNSVTIDKNLMFIANGAAGVYVAMASQEFKDTDHDEAQSITVLGKLKFNDQSSANHVTFNGDYLFVAAGLGGLKIIKVKINN